MSETRPDFDHDLYCVLCGADADVVVTPSLPDSQEREPDGPASLGDFLDAIDSMTLNWEEASGINPRAGTIRLLTAHARKSLAARPEPTDVREAINKAIECLSEAEAEAAHGKTANPGWIDMQVSEALRILRALTTATREEG